MTEGISAEIDAFAERLYAGIQAYATGQGHAGIVYDAAAYPYFFVDADGDGKADVNEKVRLSATTPGRPPC